MWRHELNLHFPIILARYPDREYHPHITLAHRDVDPKQFHEMWAHYKIQRYEKTIMIRQFCILANSKDGWAPEKFYTLKEVAL